MDFLSLLTSDDMAGLIINLVIQSSLISITGFVLIKLLSQKSAPLRSLVCAATITAMGLLIVIFIGARLSDISWQFEETSVIEQETISNIIPVSNQNEQLPIQDEPLPIEPVQHPITQSYTPLINDTAYPSLPLQHSPYSISLSSTVIALIDILGFIWIIGVLFQLSRLGYGLIVVKRFKGSLEPVKDASFNNMLNNIAVTLFRKGRLVPRLYRSSLIESPMAIGFMHPAIIIPEKLFTTLTDNELKSILLHEMAHIYHYDQVTGIIKRFVIAFHWWNPFVYIINKEHEQAREEVSDNYVLNELSPGDYSRCLMNLAEKVSLISNIPFASGMAGRGFNLIKRVEQILSKKRSNAMNTRLSLKTIVFVCIAVLTFSIAGIHARVKSVESSYVAEELKEPLQEINNVSITKEDQNPIQINIPEQKAVDDPHKLQSIANPVTMPQKELQSKQVQENKEPVIVMASVDTKAMNKIEKPMDLVNIQSSDEPALIKDVTDNTVLTQNETAEDHNLNSATVPENEVQNIKPEDVLNDTKKEDIDTAIAEISKQIELNNSDARLYLLRGNLYMDKQDYEKAVNDYTKAIEINPDDAAAYNNRGQAYVNIWEDRDYNIRRHAYENMEKYNNIVEFRQAIKDDKQADKYPFEQFMKDRKQTEQYFFNKAIKDYKKAIKIDPGNIYAYINRGNAYFAKQNYKKSISDYSRAIKIDPEFSLAYLSRGIAYLQGRNFSKAINDFSKTLELDNRNALAYQFRGNAYHSKGEYRQAIDDYSKALEINPDLISAYNNRGVAYEAMGDLDKAIYDYSRGIEVISENPDTFINPKFYPKEGQGLNAVIIFSERSVYHRFSRDSRYTDIYTNSYNNNPGEYIVTLPIMYNYNLVAYTQTPVAILSFQNYIFLEQLYSYINRGLAYEKKGQLDKAIADFSRVIEITPDHALVYIYRSEVYRKMGNEAEYKNDLNMAKKYGYEYEYPINKLNQRGYWEGVEGRKNYWELNSYDVYYQQLTNQYKYYYNDQHNEYNTPNLPPDFYNKINAQQNNSGGK